MDLELIGQSVIESPAHEPTENGQPYNFGLLAGEVCLAVHTHHALRLIWGRRRAAGKPPISGLIAFASAVNTIWRGAEEGDPYAMWWLIKIEAGIEECKGQLSEQLLEAAYLYPGAEILDAHLKSVQNSNVATTD